MSGASQTAAPGGRAGPSALDADGLRIWSCVTCRRRKVRCDRREPCANCVRNDIDCHYPVTGRIPRRRALPPGHPRSAVSDKHSILINRLRRLEGIVTELGAQVEEGAKTNGGELDFEIPKRAQSTRPLPDSTDGSLSASVPSMSTGDAHSTMAHTESDMIDNFGELVVARDGGLHVGNAFWTVFCDEVDNIFRAVEDVEFAEEEAQEAVARNQTVLPEVSSNFDFILGSASAGHPDPARVDRLAAHAPLLWQKYLENVDPFTKVLDTVSVNAIVTSFISQTSALTPDDEALLSAISLASLVSLDPEEIATNLRGVKNQMIESYIRDTESALARTQFLTQPSLMAVQAFTVYLSSLPYVGRKDAAWPLAGLLLRVATTLKLYEDASRDTETNTDTDTDLKTAELRRRLWWQICFIDSRNRDTSSLRLSITEDMFDTNEPANIDDQDLGKAVNSFAMDESKITSATLSIIRCQVWRLGRKLESHQDNPIEMKLGLVRSARNSIRGTYFFNIDAMKPFDGFLQSMTNLTFAKIESGILSQALRWKKQETSQQGADDIERIQQQTYQTCLIIVDEVYTLLNKDEWKQWRWQLRGHVPWHAMAVVLCQLGSIPWDVESEKAWCSIQALFASLSADILQTKSGMELCSLLSSVSRHRDALSVKVAATDELGVQMNSSTMTPSIDERQGALESFMNMSSMDGDTFNLMDNSDQMDLWMMDDATTFWDGIDL